MKEITVLTTACGSMFMPGFFECLKHNGERTIRIVGVDIVDNPYASYWLDAYYQVPRFSEPGYVDVLLDICSKENVDIFFPHISMELSYILDRRTEFEAQGVHIALSNPATLETASDKIKLYDYLKDCKIETPEYYPIKTVSDLMSAASALNYPAKPFVLKRSDSCGSRGVRIVSSTYSRTDMFLNEKPSTLNCSFEEASEIVSECGTTQRLYVMPYLPGCEYTVDLLADHGRILYIAGRRNYQSQSSIAMATVTEENSHAYRLCEKIVQSLALDGNIGFDFMFDETNTPVLTDLNPRITATIVLFFKAGINFPYLRVKQLLGEDLPDCSVVYGIHMRRKYLDLFE